MIDGPIPRRRLPKQDWQLMTLVASRFERAARAQEDWQKRAKECFDFVEDKQWSAEDLQKVMEQERPALTLNKIKPLVMLVCGFHLQNRTNSKFLPGIDDSGSYEVAKVLSQISRQIGQRSKIQYVDAEVFMDGIIGGRGFYDTRLDFSTNDLGEVIHRAADPFSIFLDPDGDTYDLNETCEHITETRWISPKQVGMFYGPEAEAMIRPWLGTPGQSGMPAQIMDYGPEIAPWRRFGGEFENGDNAYSDIMERFFDYFDTERKLVRVVDQQHYMTVPQRFFVDLETGDRVRVPDWYTPEKIQRVLDFGEYKNNPIAMDTRVAPRLRWTQLIGDLIVYDAWSPYETFTYTPFFPYFRRGVTKGMVESLIDPQREVNKRRSARLNLILRAANGGWIYDKETLDVQGRENLERYGSTAGVHIAFDSKNGRLSAPKQIEPAATPVAIRDLEKESEEDLKQISGINDSMLGQLDRVQSGRAIESRQKQAVIGLEVYIQNYKRGKLLLGEKELELIQGHYTEARILRITGDDGRPIDVPINQRRVATAQAAAAQVVNDVTIGKYVCTVDETPMSATFLEAQFAELLMLRDKGLPIPDDTLLEASSVGNKDEIKALVAQARMARGVPGLVSPDPSAPPPPPGAPMPPPGGAPVPAIAGPVPAAPAPAPPRAAARGRHARSRTVTAEILQAPKTVLMHLAAKMEAEAGGEGWVMWLYVPGSGARRFDSLDPLGQRTRPDEERADLTRRLCERLNREMPYGGAWLTAWFGDKRWGMFWLDEDFDIGVIVDNEEPWARARVATEEKWMADAEAGWRKAYLIKHKMLGVKPEQQHKAALGEKPPPRLIV